MANESDNITNDSKTLDELNQEMIDRLYLPLLYLLGFYMTLGILGNSSVLYIYFVKFKSYGESRYFVPPLTVIDLVASIVNCSILMTWMSSPLKHGSDLECKIKSYLCMATMLASILLLLIIAIDRYLKICRPFGKQIDLRWKIRSIVIIVIAAAVLSTPFFVFNGAVEYQYPGTNITARNCWAVDYGVPAVSMLFYGFYLLVIVAELVIMSVLYFKICRLIFRHKQVGQNDESLENSPTPEIQTNSSTLDIEEPQGSEDGTSVDVVARYTTGNNGDQTKSQTVCFNTLPRNFSTSVKKIPRSRLTIMFLIITIVFAVSFLPRVVIMVLESTGYTFSGISTEMEFFLEFLRSVYIVNNFANPFIYGCMDKRFQAELRKLLCCQLAERSRKSFARLSTILYKKSDRPKR